jgi:hypothetical protein
VCYLLTELSVIRHEPDHHLLECAPAVTAEVHRHGEHCTSALWIVRTVSVARSGELLNIPKVGRLAKKAHAEVAVAPAFDFAGALRRVVDPPGALLFVLAIIGARA